MKQKLSLIGFVLSLFLSAFALVPALALAAQQQVSLGANSISPATVTIAPGDTVVWNNTSATTQSVIGNNNLFQSGSIAPGGQFAATFNASGTYNYYDDAGGSAIVGEVIVSGNSNVTTTSTIYNNPNSNYYPTTTTTTASTNTNSAVASLEAEVQSLIAEINSIEGSSGVASTGVSGAAAYTSGGSCPQIGRVLSVGTTGSDVLSLQEFLGVSPATGYYGTITQAAVEQWQAANNIISYGTPATTGYGVVGPRTASAIRLACSEGQTGISSGSSGNSNVVSGFLQVSPISGQAPLTINATVTINTADSCSGGTYTLTYGDGSQGQVITVPSGNCSQQNQTFQYTYQNPGTYTVTLAAGSHSSSATVTVGGTGGTTTTGSPTQASGSISAFITSGPPPLATTFYVSCAAGLAYDVVFGDGTDLGSSGVSQSSCNGGLQSVAHTYTKAGGYNAALVIFTRNSQGTISSQNVATQAITVTGASATSTPSGSPASSYQAPTLTPDVGGNPLEVSLQYNYDSDGCQVSINWGDGSSLNPTGCSNFSGQQQTFTQTHTYGQTGNYIVTLERASQTDTVAVSISN